jgi:hypothetical protein
VTLYASPSTKAAYTYCRSIRFSWTDGFYLTTLGPGQNPTSADALDANGTVIATKTLSTKVIGIPSP